MTIYLWPVHEATTEVILYVTRQLGNELPTLFRSGYIPVAQFPITFPIEYEDPSIFRIYSIEPDGAQILRGTEPRPS
jgi:hypothetical protein